MMAKFAKQAEQNEKAASQDQCATVDTPVLANENQNQNETAKSKALKPPLVLKPILETSPTVTIQSTEKTSESIVKQVAEQTIEQSTEPVVKPVIKPIIEPVATPSTTESVIRHCHVFQLVPEQYKGSLSAVLEKSTEIRGNIQLLPTLCKYSRTPEIIKNLQLALQARGYLKSNGSYDLVVIDGVWGINTLSAVRAYQKDRGLAYGQLSIEVLRDLQVAGFKPL
jgi:hypothetical protein